MFLKEGNPSTYQQDDIITLNEIQGMQGDSTFLKQILDSDTTRKITFCNCLMQLVFNYSRHLQLKISLVA